jgi:GTP-binding protein
MRIKSAVFVKGIVVEDEHLRDKIPQVVFIGRSNVGKSSMINALVGKPIARSSNTPGKTREINLYLINKDLYFVDLPGYGFAQGSRVDRNELKNLIYSYLFFSDIPHKKILIIIDAEVGLTESDLYFIRRLQESKKEFIVVANKIDKLKKTEFKKKMDKVRAEIKDHPLVLCSTTTQAGIDDLWAQIV